MGTEFRDVSLSLLGCIFATGVVAEEYDYEVSLDYGRSSSDTTFVTTVNGVPDPLLGTGTTASDTDDIDLAGTWYYAGLSDAEGPKSRAAFLSRASAFSLSYGRRDGSGSFVFSSNGVAPPTSGSNSILSHSFSANLRHVWRDSSWYLLAGLSQLDTEFESVSNGIASSFDRDNTLYSFGVGKYLGKATTVDLNVAGADSGGGAVAASLQHVGSISQHWQYGVNLVLQRSTSHSDEGSYALRGTLFPSNDVEFGIKVSRQELRGGLSDDSIEAFAGWFVRDHIELTARYRQDSPDDVPGRDSDSSGFVLGAAFRF